MPWTSVLTSFLALIFVLGLIGLAAYAVRRFGAGRIVLSAGKKEGRLAVSEVLQLDMRRRLVLIKRDDAEHLLLITPERELVIESNITAKNGKGKKS